MKKRTHGRSAPRKPTLDASPTSLPPGYPVGVHLGGVKTFGRLVRAEPPDHAWVDIKGANVQVPVSVLSADAQSFSLVLTVRDGALDARLFEHRQEALGYVERHPSSAVGPVTVEAPLALQLLRLLERSPAGAPKQAQASEASSSQPSLSQQAVSTDDTVHVYTDGSCLRNPGGAGGWGVVIQYSQGQPVELSGGERGTTNNRMELQAAVMALRHLLEQDNRLPVVIWTDSEYVKKGITQWLEGWKRRGWRKADDTAVLNVDLWQTLDELNHRARAQFALQWNWVRGHNGTLGNERADELATQAARRVG